MPAIARAPEERLPAVLLALASTPALWWLTSADMVRAISYDGENHLWRTYELARIWPRLGWVPGWAPDLALGFGSPLFMYDGPLAYMLGAVGMARGLSAADGRAEVALGLVEPPRPYQRDAAAFEGGPRLVGHRIERRGEGLVVTLYWRADQPVREPYTVFVHLVDAAGRLLAQGDGPPELGERTTAEWPVGDTIVDPHAIAASAAGARVLVGLYRPSDLTRLRLADGRDTVDLGPPPAS